MCNFVVVCEVEKLHQGDVVNGWVDGTHTFTLFKYSSVVASNGIVYQR